MSILIKGMEMPKDGVYWCEIGVADDIAMITIHGEDRKSFHLVPAPSHGRLIDADALLNLEADYEHPLFDSDGSLDCVVPCYDRETIKTAPTVIEAEGNNG